MLDRTLRLCVGTWEGDIDSLKERVGEFIMDDFIPIKNIMNELYAKDISRKVRSAHNTRGRAGEPLAQPPYGYVKDPQGKKR